MNEKKETKMSEEENLWNIKIEQSAESQTIVDSTNTARAVKSGSLDVFATPMMIALMENAATNCVLPNLHSYQSTVGISINIKHFRASSLGKKIRAQAKVFSISKNKIKFRVVASDDDGEIGAGEHVRAIINISEFLQSL